jgi:drug/metabolite transporter (DMT)-like permease
LARSRTAPREKATPASHCDDNRWLNPGLRGDKQWGNCLRRCDAERNPIMTPEKRRAWLPYLLLTLTALFWSGNFVLGRGIRELIPPVSLNFWRWAGALLILMPLAMPRLRRQWPLVRQNWRLLALLSIPAISLFSTFIYTALQSTTTTNTVLVNAMTPIFIGLAGWMMFGVRMRPRQVVGVLISLAGLLFLITRGDWTTLTRFAFSRGDLWTLGAASAWAFYSVMLRKRPLAMDPLVFLAALTALGLLFLLPFYLLELGAKGGFAVSWAGMGGIAYMAVFPSVLAYIFWNRGVDMVGANRAGIFIHLMPVFTILLAAIFLGERLHPYHLMGMGLIFTGIALTSLSSR